MASRFEHGYALLIAVDQNAIPGAALPDVAKDVEAVREVLVHPDRCGYLADNVKMLSGAQSTRQGIMDALKWLRDKLKADPGGDATAVIYFTGHGHIDAGAYYLIPYDLDLDLLSTSAIRAEDFASVIRSLQPKRLFAVLDCCHAAGMEVKELAFSQALHHVALPPEIFVRGETTVAASEGAKGLETLAQGAGRAVLSSSQAEERSYLRKDGKMSIFTYHLIEALTGHAQPQAGATEVLVSDVMSHVYRRVPETAEADRNAPQHPQYQVSGNFPLALLLGGKGLKAGATAPDPLSLASAPADHHAVLTGSGAIAQGAGSVAIGRGGVFIGGGNAGNINTGTQILGDYVRGDRVLGNKIGRQINTGGGAFFAGNVTAGHDIIGRDQTNIQGSSPDEIARQFGAILAAVANHAPMDKKADAVQQVQQLKAEVEKGQHSDDGKIARIVDGLVGLVPDSISTITSAFATPTLGGIAGPVTRYVLDRIQSK